MGIGALIRQAIFLDRDGVINRAYLRAGRPSPPADLSQLEILPGVPEALLRLRTAGFRLVVVTNQPDVARGTQTRHMVQAINSALQAQLPLDEIRVCYHDASEKCTCRKPAHGMLLAAAQASNLDLAASFMVGDRWRDIEAGRRAGCRTLLIDYHYAEAQPCRPDRRVESLPAAVDWILEHRLMSPGCNWAGR